jgi:hypothetical protein
MGFLDQTVSFASNYPNLTTYFIGEIDNAADGITNYGAYDGYGTDSYYYMSYCYRPKHGRRNDPLDFGTLVSGAAPISQLNSTRSGFNSTYFNSTDFGYANDWSGGDFPTNGNDIT